LVLLTFLSLQLVIASVVGSFASSISDVHQTFSHAQDVSHHHHDAFSTHLSNNDGEAPHHHFTDSFQSVGILPLDSDSPICLDRQHLSVAAYQAPADIFLEGPLRPPQTYI